MPDDEASNSDRVADNELLYRSIRLIENNFRKESDGTVRLSSQAFTDRSKEPSVYRHNLCESPPYGNPPRLGETDAVAGLIAATIRRNSPLLHQGDEYQIDIRPEPEDHLAHAVVFARPEFPNDKPFRRLRELLTKIIEQEWPIPPNEEFIENLPIS